MPLAHLGYLIGVVVLMTISACTPPADGNAPAETPAAPEPKAVPRPNMDRRLRMRPESRAFLTVEPAAVQSQAEPIRAPGRVEFRPQAVATVGAPVPGRVGAVRVQAGDRVRAGDVLLVLHSSEGAATRATFSTARAALQLAEGSARRQAEMLAHGVGLELEKLEADIRLKEARAEFDRAQRTARLLGEGEGEQVAIRAPIAGTVVKVNTALGAAVQPDGQALLELGDADALWIVAEVFERDLPLLRQGDEARIELAIAPGHPLPGRVTAIGIAFADELRRAPVYIALWDPAPTLRPGMYARVDIQLHEDDRVLLPATAVLIKDGKRTVVYVETAEGAYEQRAVTIGTATGGRVPVLEGLRPGERVVVRGALLLDGEAEQLL